MRVFELGRDGTERQGEVMSWLSEALNKGSREQRIGAVQNLLLGGIDPAGSGMFVGTAEYLNAERKKKKKKEEAAAAGGEEGGGGEAGGGGGSGMSAAEKQLAMWFKYNPQFAEQYWKLTQQYEPQYAALQNELAGKERESTLGDISRLAPQLQGIRRSAEMPQTTAIRELLMNQVLGELGMGSKLTTEQGKMAGEQLRSAQYARGLGTGQGAANREAVGRAIEGLNLLGQRQQKASGVIAAESAQGPDPFAIIGGMPTTQTQSAVAQTQSNIKDPSLDFFSTNYWNAANLGQQQAQYNLMLQIAKANPNLDLTGTGL